MSDVDVVHHCHPKLDLSENLHRHLTPLSSYNADIMAYNCKKIIAVNASSNHIFDYIIMKRYVIQYSINICFLFSFFLTFFLN